MPAAFQLARQLKKAPRAIAQELLAGARAIEGVAAIEIAGNGYLNVRLDRGYYGAGVLLRGEGASSWRHGRQDHRRAHQYQSQQGRAHRPSAQRHPRRHLRAHAARDGPAAWKCRITSTTPACRWRDVVVGFLHPELFSAGHGADEPFRLSVLGSLRRRFRILRPTPRGVGVAAAGAAR